MMSKVFQVNQKLINHNFESYKIISEEEESKQVQEANYALPGRALGAGIDGKGTLLGYRETKDRATAKYIVHSKSDEEAAYIDENGFVILTSFSDELKPSFRPIFRIQREEGAGLPGLVSLSEDIWLVSNGAGRLDAFKMERRSGSNSGTPIGTWTLREDGEQVPFRILAASGDANIDADPNNVKVLLQHIRRTEATPMTRPGIGSSQTRKVITSSSSKAAKTTFELILGSIELRQQGTDVGDEPIQQTIDICSTLELDSSPLNVIFDKNDNVILFSEMLPAANLKEETDKENDKVLTPAPLEAAPGQKRIPPYAWTQTSETVTVVFKLPGSTGKKEINCRFTPTNIHLLLDSQSATIREIGDDVTSLDHIVNGAFANKRLWSDIEAESSFWTIEKVGKGDESSLLTLHLEKLHPGTRWPNVFKQRYMGEAATEEDDEIEEVPETLNPGDLLGMLNGLQKYTSEQDDNPVQRDLGGPSITGQPVSLLQDGLEEEDAEVGQPCFVSRLSSDGSFKNLDKNVILLATPLANSSAITIRQDLDGLVYKQEEPFTHIDTIPALSYVLASKRDANRVYVYRDPHRNQPTTILAFDSLTGAEGQGGAGNLFVYHSPIEYNSNGSPKINNQGQSRVIRLGSGIQGDASGMRIPSGPLIDVTTIKSKGGESALLILCQERLLIIRNVL